jgi:hypothetical protein
MARLDILEEIERKADGYSLINIITNICLQIVGIYATIELSTYIWRQLTGH